MNKRSQLRLACIRVPKEKSVEEILAFAEQQGLKPFVERNMRVRLTVTGGSLHYPNCTVYFNAALKSSRAKYYPER